ncbi:unnamed protein product [Amoebophrya sp. A120]|nr:unnamed protein product [Amoebophrya sp. A120]|eukprot:GSA120T00022255001.1
MTTSSCTTGLQHRSRMALSHCKNLTTSLRGLIFQNFHNYHCRSTLVSFATASATVVVRSTSTPKIYRCILSIEARQLGRVRHPPGSVKSCGFYLPPRRFSSTKVCLHAEDEELSRLSPLGGTEPEKVVAEERPTEHLQVAGPPSGEPQRISSPPTPHQKLHGSSLATQLVHQEPSQLALRRTWNWVEKWVIGKNICPFAKPLVDRQKLRIALFGGSTVAELCQFLKQELRLLELFEDSGALLGQNAAGRGSYFPGGPPRGQESEKLHLEEQTSSGIVAPVEFESNKSAVLADDYTSRREELLVRDNSTVSSPSPACGRNLFHSTLIVLTNAEFLQDYYDFYRAASCLEQAVEEEVEEMVALLDDRRGLNQLSTARADGKSRSAAGDSTYTTGNGRANATTGTSASCKGPPPPDVESERNKKPVQLVLFHPKAVHNGYSCADYVLDCGRKGGDNVYSHGNADWTRARQVEEKVQSQEVKTKNPHTTTASAGHNMKSTRSIGNAEVLHPSCPNEEEAFLRSKPSRKSNPHLHVDEASCSWGAATSAGGQLPGLDLSEGLLLAADGEDYKAMKTLDELASSRVEVGGNQRAAGVENTKSKASALRDLDVLRFYSSNGRKSCRRPRRPPCSRHDAGSVLTRERSRAAPSSAHDGGPGIQREDQGEACGRGSGLALEKEVAPSRSCRNNLQQEEKEEGTGATATRTFLRRTTTPPIAGRPPFFSRQQKMATFQLNQDISASAELLLEREAQAAFSSTALGSSLKKLDGSSLIQDSSSTATNKTGRCSSSSRERGSCSRMTGRGDAEDTISFVDDEDQDHYGPNYVLRAPYPTIHLLRQVDVDNAKAKYGEKVVEKIPERNFYRLLKNDLAAGLLSSNTKQSCLQKVKAEESPAAGDQDSTDKHKDGGRNGVFHFWKNEIACPREAL